MSDKDLSWMQAICDPARPGLKTPFPATVDGRRVSVASDGAMLIMADGGDFPPNPRAPTDDGMASLLKGLDGPRATVRLDDLRQWAGLTSEPCKECGGKRVVKCSTCRGRGQHECRTCDAEHDCGHCDGTGKVECDCTPPIRPGRIGTFGVDRRRVACVVAHATDTTVEVLLADNQLGIFGAGWMALVMGLRDVAADVPTFALDGDGCAA